MIEKYDNEKEPNDVRIIAKILAEIEEIKTRIENLETDGEKC